MLMSEQVTEIWHSLERTGAEFNQKYGRKPIKQSAALDEMVSMTIARRALEATKEVFTREQILEAYCLLLMQTVARLNGYTPNEEKN